MSSTTSWRRALAVTGLALALALGSSDASAQSARPVSSQAVRALLRAPDTSLDAAGWKRLGTGVEAELMRAASDPSLLWGSRARAYSVLGHFPSPATRRFLEGALADRALPAAFRAPVIRALGWGWGETEPVAIRRLMWPFRADADARVRGAALHVIAVAGTPRSRPSDPRSSPLPR